MERTGCRFAAGLAAYGGLGREEHPFLESGVKGQGGRQRGGQGGSSQSGAQGGGRQEGGGQAGGAVHRAATAGAVAARVTAGTKAKAAQSGLQTASGVACREHYRFRRNLILQDAGFGGRAHWGTFFPHLAKKRK